ncbi:hypothetical protein BCR36DRAFT_584741 [Piromyces finnis]|uniref:Uncharacterized protein n=1 Tax=Piromyces finnis TaxID=1754191 RepID=A0A1Y1V5G8_9FUNG|nr:hypothetical protein BCR36DRAFT_584741 [Piromyces finnis]|eukprot:ORX47634.1 hypothetical protein BCR36DRAFT_584741 [Piromyces finnis]
MAKFKKILSFLKGSKKRKSVVIHDSKTIRNNEINIGGLAGNGNRRFGTTTGRPIVGNGGHYEQFLYIDDVKNGGLKKRTLSVAPSVVSSSNYTQTDQEFSETLSHLRSESSKLNRNSSKPISSRNNSIGNTAFNKTPTNGKKGNKSFILRQDPIEEEKIIVEVKDNDKEEIEIDEDELIAAVHEFDNEIKRNSGASPTSIPTENATFILKEDKEDEDGNQSFIIKNINDDIQTKKLSFIISSTNCLEDVEEESEENLNQSVESYLLSTPNLNYNDNEEDNDVNIKVEGIENMKKDYLANNKESLNDKNISAKESLIQFQPPEFSITNEKVYNYRNNDLIKKIFKKIPHENGHNEVLDEDEEFSSIHNKRKVNFVLNTHKGNSNDNNIGETLTKQLSVKSSDAVFYNHTPKPILVSSPTLNKSSTISSLPDTNTMIKEHTITTKSSINDLDSISIISNKKLSDEAYLPMSNRINENIKQSNCAYTSTIPSTNTRNIYYMPLPRPSQATLLDFGNSAKNSPSLVPKKSNIYNHTNHSLGNFPSTKEISSCSRRHLWSENHSIKSKESNLFSAPLKASIPIVKSPKEEPVSCLSNAKVNPRKINNIPSINTPFIASSHYETPKSKKEKTCSPYTSNKTETQSTLTEISSYNSFFSDIQKDDISRISKDKQYLHSINISIKKDENDDIIDCHSNSSITSNNGESSFAYGNYNEKLSKSREESLRNVKEYVKSLDEKRDSDSLFSTPLAYRKRYEKYGSLRSRTSNKSYGIRNSSFSTINGSLKSSNALKSKHSSQSNKSDATENSSITEYSNFSEHNSSFSINTNSTNRTAPTQNSIYSRDYCINPKKYNPNKHLPLSSTHKIEGEDVKRKEKFNSDSTIVSSYNKKYNIKSTPPMKQGKHQNSSSISSASTLACSPLPGPRSLLNNSNNLNKLSLVASDSNYFDDFMKDLNNMSLNDLISKYEQKTE